MPKGKAKKAGAGSKKGNEKVGAPKAAKKGASKGAKKGAKKEKKDKKEVIAKTKANIIAEIIGENDEEEYEEEEYEEEYEGEEHEEEENEDEREESSGSWISMSSSSSCDNSGINEKLSESTIGGEKSSMTLIESRSLTDNECAELMTKEGALIKKCQHEKEDDDESHQKEPPDFNYITTYESYLDHYVTSKDLYYFESDHIARTITTLGFRVPELLTREEFTNKMKDIQARRFERRKDDILTSYRLSPNDITCPLMQALASRERANRTGKSASIIYIRTVNHKHQEISGWIDFKVRLGKDDSDIWNSYFTGKQKFLPRPTDLCYYNWSTFQIRYNSSENYLVTTDIKEGLQFMNNLDRKLITVNPKASPGDNTKRFKIKSQNYLDAVVYDHSLRVKA